MCVILLYTPLDFYNKRPHDNVELEKECSVAVVLSQDSVIASLYYTEKYIIT